MSRELYILDFGKTPLVASKKLSSEYVCYIEKSEYNRLQQGLQSAGVEIDRYMRERDEAKAELLKRDEWETVARNTIAERDEEIANLKTQLLINQKGK